MKNIINLLFKWWGRITRKEYIVWLILGWVFTYAIDGIISLIVFLIFKENFIVSIIIWAIFWSIIQLAYVYISANLIVKRLHDLWKQRSNIFLFLIPFFNIYYFFKLLVEKWEDKENEFGNERTNEKTISVVAPIIIAIILFWITLGVNIYLMSWTIKNISWAINSEWFYRAITENPLVKNMLWYVSWIIKNNGAYQLSLQEINTNPVITDIYWKFDVWVLPMGSISTVWPDGDASLQIKIKWEKGNWDIYVNLEKKYWERKIINMVSVDSQNNQKYIIWSGE